MKYVLFLFAFSLSLLARSQSQAASALMAPSLEATMQQVEQRSIYSGGMLLFQPGYTTASNDRQVIQASSMAIGGILRTYVGKHWTVGIYGGSQKTTYSTANATSSYLNLGYGGPLLGWTHKTGKYRYTVSAFVGMGSIKNLHIESQSNETLTEAYLYTYSTMVYSPILSLDYSLTKRLSLTFQALCLMGTYDGGKNLFNPTMQVGILFNR